MPLKQQEMQTGSELVQRNTEAGKRELEKKMPEISKLSVVETHDRIQLQMPNSEVAKEGEKLFEEGDFEGLLVLYAQNEQTAPLLREDIERNARDAGIDETLIKQGVVWRYFQQYVNEISKQQQINRRATEEFAAEQLKLGFIEKQNEMDAVDETKRA